jgi:prepilin-type N-terminal cleavage/methylation domain-containing protein
VIRRRAGFTIVELMAVVIVLGILAGIGILKYIDLTHRARTAQITGDLHAVRIAAYGAMYENGTWPTESSAGVVPPGLAPYLPANFSFVKPEYTLDWENFVPPGGGSAQPFQVGMVVSATNPRLQHTLEQMFSNRLPFIISGPDGVN